MDPFPRRGPLARLRAARLRPPLRPCPRAAHCCCVVQGLLLDLDAATLTVWVNGERKGVMVHPGGMTSDSGLPVPRLEGPLHWAVDAYDASVVIAGPLPPPA